MTMTPPNTIDTGALITEEMVEKARRMVVDHYDVAISNAAVRMMLLAVVHDIVKAERERSTKLQAWAEDLESGIGQCGCTPGRCEQHPETELFYYGRLCREAIRARGAL